MGSTHSSNMLHVFFLLPQITSKFAVIFITVQYNVTISANGKLRHKLQMVYVAPALTYNSSFSPVVSCSQD